MMKKYKIYRESVILCVLLLLTQSCLNLFSSTTSKSKSPSRTFSNEELFESVEDDQLSMFAEELPESVVEDPGIPDLPPAILE